MRLAELTNSLQTLHRTITEMGGYEVHTHFLRLSFASRRQYDKNCVEFVKDIATAKYIFADEASNVLSCVPMRPETIVTQTWHGCGAFKKFGFSTADLIFGLNREQQLKYPFYKKSEMLRRMAQTYGCTEQHPLINSIIISFYLHFICS